MNQTSETFEIPNHWRRARLGDATKEVTRVKPEDTPEKKFTYIDISSIDNDRYRITEPKHYVGSEAPSRARQLIRQGDILFSTVRTYLKNVALVPEGHDGDVASTGFCVVRPVSELVNGRFLFYYCLTPAFIDPLNKKQRGTSYPAVRDEDVFEQEIPLPPLSEQRRIVAKIEELFSNLDAGVSSLQTAQKQLERYRLSVLQAAVEGRLTASWRQEHDDVEPAEELLERILEERREQWEERYRWKRYDSKGKEPPSGWKDRYTEPDSCQVSGLPDIPETWKWVRFEQVSLLDSGKAFKSENFQDEGMPLLRGANVAPGHLKWDDTEYWPEDEVEQYSHLIVNEGDVILAMDRPLISDGLKIARAKQSETPCLLVQRVARFRPVLSELAPFLYLACSTRRFIRHLREGQTGTQIPHVSKKSIRAFPIPLPPVEEIKQIANQVDRLLSVAEDGLETSESEQKRAQRLRQSILKQAFSGKLVAHDGQEPDQDGKPEDVTEAAGPGGDSRGDGLPGSQMQMDL